MKVSDDLFTRLCQAFNRIDLVTFPEVRHAVEAALTDVPEPDRELCDGDHEGPSPAWHDGVDGLRQRLEQAEARIAKLRRSPRKLERSIRGMQVILVNAHKWRVSAGCCERPDLDELERILLEDHETDPRAGLALVKRIVESEAKLAKVRAWAEFYTPESVGETELWAILEDHEPPRSSFRTRRVVSEPGAAIKLTALELTPAAQQALSTGGARIPAEPAGMLGSLQAWWQEHALALRMTSKSVHKAIGVAISALEQVKPFPTMQVLADVPEPADDLTHAQIADRFERRARTAEARLVELEAKLATQLARADRQHHRAIDAERKLARVRDLAHTDLPIEYERRFLEIIDHATGEP